MQWNDMQWIGFHLIRMLSIGMDIKGMDSNGTVCNGMDSNAMDSNGFVAGVGCVVSGAVTGRDEPLWRWALRTGRRRAGLLGPAESGDVRQKLALAHRCSLRDNCLYRASFDPPKSPP